MCLFNSRYMIKLPDIIYLMLHYSENTASCELCTYVDTFIYVQMPVSREFPVSSRDVTVKWITSFTVSLGRSFLTDFTFLKWRFTDRLTCKVCSSIDKPASRNTPRFFTFSLTKMWLSRRLIESRFHSTLCWFGQRL